LTDHCVSGGNPLSKSNSTTSVSTYNTSPSTTSNPILTNVTIISEPPLDYQNSVPNTKIPPTSRAVSQIIHGFPPDTQWSVNLYKKRVVKTVSKITSKIVKTNQNSAFTDFDEEDLTYRIILSHREAINKMMNNNQWSKLTWETKQKSWISKYSIQDTIYPDTPLFPEEECFQEMLYGIQNWIDDKFHSQVGQYMQEEKQDYSMIISVLSAMELNYPNPITFEFPADHHKYYMLEIGLKHGEKLLVKLDVEEKKI